MKGPESHDETAVLCAEDTIKKLQGSRKVVGLGKGGSVIGLLILGASNSSRRHYSVGSGLSYSWDPREEQSWTRRLRRSFHMRDLRRRLVSQLKGGDKNPNAISQKPWKEKISARMGVGVSGLSNYSMKKLSMILGEKVSGTPRC